jgi:cyclic AMP-responsive element-binding protein 3
MKFTDKSTMNNETNEFLSDWTPADDGGFLDSILNMETDLLSDFGQSTTTATDIDLNSDIMDICKDSDNLFNNLDDFPNYFKEEPIFSSGASDSGLSSDNLDVDINQDYDLLSSCLSSPISTHSDKFEPQLASIVKVEPDEVPSVTRDIQPTQNQPAKPVRQTKREIQRPQKYNDSALPVKATKNSRNSSGSNAKNSTQNGNNNNSNKASNKKNDQKVLTVKAGAGVTKQRSILVPVSAQNIKEFHTIKIVKSNSSQLKSPNIKAVAANLLQKSKQGLLNKNIYIPKEELAVDDTYNSQHETDDDYTFEEVFHQSNVVTSSGKERDYDDHNDDSGSDSGNQQPNANGQYPKLILTAEEKRLLAKEGISLPTNYPLTKHEERELKRIRRKIRNKISAQDSRKRKKEYIDGLEERVKQCSEENQHLMKKIKILQSQNHDLMSQMKKLQMLLSRSTSKTSQPATCLMILLLSMALVALPNMKLGQNKSADLASILSEDTVAQQNRRNLLFDFKESSQTCDDIEVMDDEVYCTIPNEHNYVESTIKYDDMHDEFSAKRARNLVDYDIDVDDNWNKKTDKFDMEAKKLQEMRKMNEEIRILEEVLKTNQESQKNEWDPPYEDPKIMAKNKTDFIADVAGEIMATNSIINIAHTNIQKNAS